MVQKNERNEAAFKPPIPLGTVGRWKNVRYEVVGFMRRGITVDGILYEWSEYLLHNVERGYAWITEYNGHYSVVHNCAEIPKHTSVFSSKPRGALPRHTPSRTSSASQAKVTYLAGEFYWRVQLGDENLCNDYVDPPLILSTRGERQRAHVVGGRVRRAARALEGLQAEDQAARSRRAWRPTSPRPHKGKVGRYWLAFLAFAALGVRGAAALLDVAVVVAPAAGAVRRPPPATRRAP